MKLLGDVKSEAFIVDFMHCQIGKKMLIYTVKREKAGNKM